MPADKLRVYNDALRHIGDIRLVTLTDDVEARYVLDTAWDEVVAFVLRQAPWQFALKTTGLTPGGTPILGYSDSYGYPTDWLRTHALYLSAADGREHPVDLRESDEVISTQTDELAMRYVSSDFIDPAAADWPEHFAQTVAAYLAFHTAERITGERASSGRLSQLFSQLLGEAIRFDAIEENFWLPHQRTGDMLRGALMLLREGNWRFAIDSATLTASGTPAAGYDFAFAIPDDLLRTQALFIAQDGDHIPFDVREQGGTWSANINSITVQFVSKARGADSTLWPEPFMAALRLWLEGGAPPPDQRQQQGRRSDFADALSMALTAEADLEDPWLRWQRSGEMLVGAGDLLRTTNWRFALKDAQISVESGTPAGGMAHSFAQPADWLRTHKLFLSLSGREVPLDVREQAGFWSCNESLFWARYVSRTLGQDTTRWLEPFRAALLAYLRAGRPAIPADGRQAPAPEWYAEFQRARDALAEPDDPLLSHQLDGSMLHGARDVLSETAWRFALKTVAPTASGSPIDGYAHSWGMPADLLRTHALFKAGIGREHPVDIRETDGRWHTNDDAFLARYVSTDGLDATLWPDPFLEALRDYFRWRDAAPQAAEAMRTLYAGALAAAIPGHALPPDVWLPYQLSGRMIAGAYMLLRQGFWRFALATAPAAAGGTTIPGYAHAFVQPDDWLQTHALFIAGAGREAPFDVREQGGHWYANIEAFSARYISKTRGLDSSLWPETFDAVLLAWLDGEHREVQAGQQQPVQAAFPALLAAALATEAEPPNLWLPHQLCGQFESSKLAVLRQGYWVYRDDEGVMRGLREVQYSTDDQLSTQPGYGFAYRYPLPADWFKTHALFQAWDGHDCPINIRQTSHDWSTDAENFIARYVATDILDPVSWPQEIEDAVYAHAVWQRSLPAEAKLREQEYRLALTTALDQYSQPEDDWLRFQLDGSFITAVVHLLEHGRWRFAIRTLDLTETTDPIPAELADGTVSSGYGYRFIVPNDLLRTVRVYYGSAPGTFGNFTDRIDIDYRDEGGAFHANYTPITVRYVSRLGLDSTKWPASFRIAVLAWLEYNEARRDPAKTAIAQAKLVLYKDAAREAEYLDDQRDMPRIVRPGLFVRARFGNRLRSSSSGASSIITNTVSVPTTPETNDVVLTDEEGNLLTDQSGNVLTAG